MDGDYRGDDWLLKLLGEAGTGLTVAQVRAIIRGVLAAPASHDPGAWLRLITPESHPNLEHQLQALMGHIAETTDDGLDAPGGPERLAALRREMESLWLQGFIVPRADEHQGEYVARCSERLAWLTGFTGSAGVAVVLLDRAALFVDGRYTLQARAEVDSDAFQILHVTETPPHEWIAKNIQDATQAAADRMSPDAPPPPPRPRLGYDPWLHTPDGVKHLEIAMEKAGGRLFALDENPVDTVWTDRPPPPLAPVVPHPSQRPAPDKKAEIVRTLETDGQDAVVLTAPDSIAWLFNIRGGDVPHTPLALGFAIVERDGSARLFMHRRKLTHPARSHLESIAAIEPPDALGPALDDLGRARKRVRLDHATAAAWIRDRLSRAGSAVSAGTDPCQLPKARKTPDELDGMRAAHRRDGAALTRFLGWLDDAAPRGGVTELTAAAMLEDFRSANENFRGLSFPTISGAGPNGAIVHYRVSAETDHPLEAGNLYLVDSGAQYLDGTTDVTRTVAIGEPTADMKDRFTRVLKGHIAIATARFPKGTTGSQLDALARWALWQAGLDYDHGTGHGVGCYLSVHEGPQRISKLPSKVALEPGMVISNEPGYYREGAYGIRIENLVVVTQLDAANTPGMAETERDMLGFETLTLAPIDRRAVNRGLLSVDEVVWLNGYHERVKNVISPLVDSATADWLARATRPL